MRRTLASLGLVLAAAGGTGCSPAQTPPPAAQSSAPGPVRQDPRVAAACADARKIINEATARFSVALERAVRAGENGRTGAQNAAIGDIRKVFAEWSAGMRAEAKDAPNDRLTDVFTAYAAAVDATIARVSKPEDLDFISTFDDYELDVMASQLQDACP